MIYILGLDGLEYDVVEYLNLENLKQAQHNKIDVPINKRLGEPITPEVWASFLCGKHVPLDFGCTKRLWLRNFLVRLNKHWEWLRRRNLTRKLTGATRFKELNESTWLDKQYTEEYNVPYYSYDNKILDLINDLFIKLPLEDYRLLIEKFYHDQIDELYSQARHIRKDTKVYFGFLHFPDAFHHVWYNHMPTIYRYYEKIDHFAGVLKHRVGDQLMIVSDHGFDFTEKKHSSYGFFSTSKVMAPAPKSIIELGQFIFKEVKEN